MLREKILAEWNLVEEMEWYLEYIRDRMKKCGWLMLVYYDISQHTPGPCCEGHSCVLPPVRGSILDHDTDKAIRDQNEKVWLAYVGLLRSHHSTYTGALLWGAPLCTAAGPRKYSWSQYRWSNSIMRVFRSHWLDSLRFSVLPFQSNICWHIQWKWEDQF
jgi:hypothetical protein